MFSCVCCFICILAPEFSTFSSFFAALKYFLFLSGFRRWFFALMRRAAFCCLSHTVPQSLGISWTHGLAEIDSRWWMAIIVGFDSWFFRGPFLWRRKLIRSVNGSDNWKRLKVELKRCPLVLVCWKSGESFSKFNGNIFMIPY